MKRYRVALLGTGVRGKTHLKGLLENEEGYEIAGLCDLDEARMRETAQQFHLDVPLFTDGELMLKTVRPDVFVFVTHPDLRLQMAELAAKYEIKGLSMEKPMAESLQEARAIKEICEKHKIKAVVCHQQKYLRQMQNMRRQIEEGDIGDIVKIHVETQPWLAQLGTHYVDYILWVNGGHKAEWAVGHVHGTAALEDSHPSPDYMLGEFMMENKVRAYIECGYLSESHHPGEYADIDNRLTVYGTEGYLWAETDGWWGACTPKTGGRLVTGKEPGWYHHQEKEIQTPYYREFANWLEDDGKPHSCNIDISCHGYEILEAVCISALDHRRVNLPLTNLDYPPVFERMRGELPDVGTTLRVLYDGKKPRKEYD